MLFCVCGDDEKLSVIRILRIPRISTILPRLESLVFITHPYPLKTHIKCPHLMSLLGQLHEAGLGEA